MARIFDNGSYWYLLKQEREQTVLQRTPVGDIPERMPERGKWVTIPIEKEAIDALALKQVNSFFGTKFAYREEQQSFEADKIFTHENFSYRVIQRHGKNALQRCLKDAIKDNGWQDTIVDNKEVIRIHPEVLQLINIYFQQRFLR